ncbi:hypothetical protein CHS0354_008281 [Potamilus streckersoni]|uniref:Uncharacterized protein n=1 Tax=Potamilus streckersoni TaxID=2493646 RepID=A0AAE0VX55_9BIVA|nr:hypothetical protein CHS0354_008281 [Potamilus streckersoni]
MKRKQTQRDKQTEEAGQARSANRKDVIFNPGENRRPIADHHIVHVNMSRFYGKEESIDEFFIHFEKLLCVPVSAVDTMSKSRQAK